MKKILFALLAFFCLQVLAFAQNTSPFFSSYPALTPDGQTLIFSYDGNLWKVHRKVGCPHELNNERTEVMITKNAAREAAFFL